MFSQNPRQIILDTNFLLIPYKFKINLFDSIENLLQRSHQYVISSQTLVELEWLSSPTTKDGRAARLALKLLSAQNKKFRIVQNSQKVDDWIVEYAPPNHAIVCTNDTELRRRLKNMKIKIITMKSRCKLGFV